MTAESATAPSVDIVDGQSRNAREAVIPALYGTIALAAISLWLISLRAPLFLDETFSFWQIHGGIREIFARHGSVSPAYPYLLYFFTRITGTSEWGLRLPSLVAMLAATYLLYRAAADLFDRDTAKCTVILFCAHPIVAYLSVDARPYAFGTLAATAAIYLLVRLRRTDSRLVAAAFGACAGIIASFQLVSVVILPVLAVGLFFTLRQGAEYRWRSLGIALLSFTIVFLPHIPLFLGTFHARQALVFENISPQLSDLGWTLAPGKLVYLIAAVVLIAVVSRKFDTRSSWDGWTFGVSVSLALVPVLVLYIVTVNTASNVFIERYRFIALPGMALAWSLVLRRIDSRFLRVLFCGALVATTAFTSLRSPARGRHGYTWQYALQFVQANTVKDNAPILMCSDFPNADYVAMPPTSEIKDSALFTPLSYYPVSAPVTGLPRALNNEAMRVGLRFVADARARHQRFLAIAWGPSYPTMAWLTQISSDDFEVNDLAELDSVVVLEFKPRYN